MGLFLKENTDWETKQTEEPAGNAWPEPIPGDDNIASFIEGVREAAEGMDEKLSIILEKDARESGLYLKMYEDLRSYRDDLLQDLIKPVMADILQAYEYGMAEVRKQGGNEAAERILDDLRDILNANDVEKFVTDGEYPDPKRHKIVKTVATGDKSIDRKICEKLSPGYVMGNKVIKAERISVYKYEN